jgi:2,4-dienoyl-CoA reductase-like NADH-dependent reductase (Old Yellow Enzyme family)
VTQTSLGREGSAADLEHLWEPLAIGPTTVANRVMSSAHALLYNQGRFWNDRHAAYYRERAAGGCALLISETTAAHPMTHAEGSSPTPVSWDPDCIPGFRKVADAVHAEGSAMFVQLFAAGAHDRGALLIDDWRPLWGVSGVPGVMHREQTLTMSAEQLADVAHWFGKSAANSAAAGMDGVEVQGAHSYLIGQSLSPHYNKRDDEYGGSVERRCKLALEIGRSVRRAVGDSVTVGFRMSYDELIGPAGITQEMSDEILEILAAADLFDYFSISAGGYHTLSFAVAPMDHEPGHLVPFAHRAKGVLGDRARVFAVGRILEAPQADSIIGDGAADMVAITRQHIADPRLVEKWRSGRESEVVQCVGDNDCFAPILLGLPVSCPLNPVTGREAYWGEGKLTPAATQRRVAVVGAGPAGMKAAALAARRGHEVTLFEQGSEVGGHLNLWKRLPSRQRWQKAIDSFAGALEPAGVDLRLGVRADEEELSSGDFEVVVLATGARYSADGASVFRPDRAAVPGAPSERMIGLDQAIERACQDGSLGDRVIVVEETGEGQPLLLAEMLALGGAEVHVMTPLPAVGEVVARRLQTIFFMPRLRAAGVEIITEATLESFDGTTARIADLWGGPERQLADVDTIVLSGLRDPVPGPLTEELPGVATHTIGDALVPRQLREVVYEGEKLGRSLD